MGEDTENEIKRIIVVGLNRPRLSKVMSLVAEVVEDDKEESAGIVEYIPCLAAMSSYEDEEGKEIRYMSNFVYQDGSPMTKFFDDEEFRLNLALVLMVGYEWMEPDIQYVSNYFHTNNLSVNVECVHPNDGFSSLHSEMDFFKNLSEDEKAEHISNQTFGPGKMARFILDMSKTWNETKEDIDNKVEEKQPSEEDEKEQSTIEEPNNDQKDPEQIQERRQITIDPELPMFACRICRTILLGQNHLAEDHVQNLHTFNKRSHGATNKSNKAPCQSLFCDESVLEWLSGEQNNDEVEGRLHCPKCSNKLGHWNWSGAQCSCGTWIVPAIQIPLSKVDTILPTSQSSPTPFVTASTIIQ